MHQVFDDACGRSAKEQVPLGLLLQMRLEGGRMVFAFVVFEVETFLSLVLVDIVITYLFLLRYFFWLTAVHTAETYLFFLLDSMAGQKVETPIRPFWPGRSKLSNGECKETPQHPYWHAC